MLIRATLLMPIRIIIIIISKSEYARPHHRSTLRVEVWRPGVGAFGGYLKGGERFIPPVRQLRSYRTGGIIKVWSLGIYAPGTYRRAR
jgi:hypothetical protein